MGKVQLDDLKVFTSSLVRGSAEKGLSLVVKEKSTGEHDGRNYFFLIPLEKAYCVRFCML